MTRLSAGAGVLSAAAVLAAGILSFLEDQRSLNPSNIILLHFSASSILYLPLLRSLWLINHELSPRALWTSIFVFTVAVVLIESTRKTKILRPEFDYVTAEQMTGFWGRSFFIWVLPFLRSGYSRILQLSDIPDVDEALQEKRTSLSLDISWKRFNGRFRLLRAAFYAYMASCLSAILPRLALSAFNLCQPFLIQAAVMHLDIRADDSNRESGQALVGAFILVYTGIAVSSKDTFALPGCTNTKPPGITCSVLAPGVPHDQPNTVRPNLQALPAYRISSGCCHWRFRSSHLNGDGCGTNRTVPETGP